MESYSTKIMVVDDELASRELIGMALKNDFDVVPAESGEQCIEQLSESKTDLILMDVEMPNGINGYETCRRVRENLKGENIPIIFLSSRTDLKDKLNGYEAGGDDYIAKPVIIPELTAKIYAMMDVRREQQKRLSQSQSLVMEVLTNTSEYGVINEFIGKSFESENYTQLADSFLAALSAFDLKACVQIRGFNRDIEFATGGEPCKPLESDLMTALRRSERIKSFGNRLALNFDRASLLIKNMPMDDADKCSRLKDHLAIMMNALESRIKGISITDEHKQAIMLRVNEALQKIDKELNEIEEDFSKRDQSTTKIIDSLLSEMTEGFSSLALTLEQEQYFIKLVNDNVEKVIQLFYTGQRIDHRFHSISESLHNIISSEVLGDS